MPFWSRKSVSNWNLRKSWSTIKPQALTMSDEPLMKIHLIHPYITNTFTSKSLFTFLFRAWALSSCSTPSSCPIYSYRVLWASLCPRFWALIYYWFIRLCLPRSLLPVSFQTARSPVIATLYIPGQSLLRLPLHSTTLRIRCGCWCTFRPTWCYLLHLLSFVATSLTILAVLIVTVFLVVSLVVTCISVCYTDVSEVAMLVLK